MYNNNKIIWGLGEVCIKKNLLFEYELKKFINISNVRNYF